MPVRELARMTAEVLVASPRFLTAPLYRHWHLRWGATNAEVVSAMPGDEIVPEPSFTATRAITIAASPEQVWPWIVQIGTRRAGFYSYDLFDNAARPSADHILPEFQATRIGDWVPMSSTVNQTTAFKVKAFQPNQWLLWAKPHSTWSWTAHPGRRRPHPPGHAAEGAVSLALIAGTGPAHPDLVRVRRLPDDAQAPGRYQTAGRATQRRTRGCRTDSPPS